jgi:hypothetical protein
MIRSWTSRSSVPGSSGEMGVCIAGHSGAAIPIRVRFPATSWPPWPKGKYDVKQENS